MNLKTTIFLLVLALILGGTYYFISGHDPREDTAQGRILFPGLLSEDVTEVLLEDRSHRQPAEPLVLTRGDEGWTLSSPARPGLHPVRARTTSVAEVISAVQELAWIRKVAAMTAGEQEQYGFGEVQKTIVTLRRAGQDSVVLEFGAEVGYGGILCRKGGSMDVYEVDAVVRDQVLPTEELLRDPRVLPYSALAVRGLEVKDRQGVRFHLSREFSGWFLAAPFSAPADLKRSEHFRNVLMGLTIQGYSARPAETEALPNYEVRIDLEGRDEPLRVFVREELNGLREVMVEGRPERYLVDPTIIGLLDREAGYYRDRRLFSFPASQVAAVKVYRGDTPALDIRRLGGSFILDLRRDDLKLPTFHLDPVEAGNFLERLISLELETAGLGARDFPASLTVAVVRKVPEQATEIAYAVSIGDPDERDRCSVRVLGEAAVGRMPQADLEFFTDPYWKLLERTIISDGAYFELARIEITRGAEDPIELRGAVGGDGRLHTWLGEGSTAREVPWGTLEPVVKKLVYFTVQSYLGEVPADDLGFDAPYLKVRWFRSSAATKDHTPQDLAEGTWNEVIVAPPGPDGRYPARWNLHPALIFTLESSDLRPFLNIVTWAGK